MKRVRRVRRGASTTVSGNRGRARACTHTHTHTHTHTTQHNTTQTDSHTHAHTQVGIASTLVRHCGAARGGAVARGPDPFVGADRAADPSSGGARRGDEGRARTWRAGGGGKA